jgi:hypothetical protein
VVLVHTAFGSVARSDVDADVTRVSVLAFTAAVPAEIAEASEDVAIATRESVFALTELVIPAVAELVFAFMTAANDEVPIATRLSVLLLIAFVLFEIATPIDVEAVETVVPTVVTSDCKAKLPEFKPAPVSVRVVLVHTSSASEPSEVRVRAE